MRERKKQDEMRERRKASVLLFIVIREGTVEETDKRKKICVEPCRGRKVKEKPFKANIKERICFINSQSSCSGRIHVKGVLINKSVRMISPHILAGIQIQGLGDYGFRSARNTCFEDPIKPKKTNTVGTSRWEWKAKAKISDHLP